MPSGIVIIGSGISGIPVAWALMRQGKGKNYADRLRTELLDSPARSNFRSTNLGWTGR